MVVVWILHVVGEVDCRCCQVVGNRNRNCLEAASLRNAAAKVLIARTSPLVAYDLAVVLKIVAYAHTVGYTLLAELGWDAEQEAEFVLVLGHSTVVGGKSYL